MLIARTAVAALSLLAVTSVFAALPAQAATARLECTAEGPNDISMRARFEIRDNKRRKFNTEFEAAPGGAFTAGQRMVVLVATFKAGTDKLRTVVGGDVAGKLELDDAAGPGDNEKPFPPGFPDVNVDTKVTVKIAGDTVLSCRLR